MTARIERSLALSLAALALLAGCQFVPKSEFAAVEAHARGLAEKNLALEAEIANRREHVAHMEERANRAEEDLALLTEEMGLDRRRLTNYEQERDELKRRVGTLTSPGGQIPVGVTDRLVSLAEAHRNLVFDPTTGIAKLDTDVLFDTAETHLRPDAQRMLEEFAAIFQETTARDLKIMVVGHTDDRGVAKKPSRERYSDNWQLSTGRALAVADFLRKCGVPADRMGVAGFADHQPVAAASSAEDRNRNRRVEIFVMGPETPIVGWTETIPSVYR